MELSNELQNKLAILRQLLAETGGVLVAYSGGVDSTLLAYLAHEVLGERAVAVHAASEVYPENEGQEALRLAGELNFETLTIHTEELDRETFAANPPDRCYYCKLELFTELNQIAHARGLSCVLDGANADDRSDHRPGARAGRELGVRSPLMEVGMTKPEIRQLAQFFGLPNWDKPSMACLASRFPYGTRIDATRLTRVGRAEESLRQMGLRQLRVRYHGDLARIELSVEDFPVAIEQRNRITAEFRALGFTYVTLDLLGYRTGSMNEVLTPEEAALGVIPS